VLEALKNALRIGELRTKLLITAALLIVFRIGSFIPVPGVDAVAQGSRCQGTAGRRRRQIGRKQSRERGRLAPSPYTTGPRHASGPDIWAASTGNPDPDPRPVLPPGHSLAVYVAEPGATSRRRRLTVSVQANITIA